MKAYREIREATSGTIAIVLPEELCRQRVEIIVLPLEEQKPENETGKQSLGWPQGFFERFAGSIPDFPNIESEGDYEKREVLA